MERPMTNEFIPIGNVIAADIRDLKQAGLLLPLQKSDQTILVIDWGGTMHGVMLTGDHAFINFPVNVRNPHVGLFVPEPEILVDFSSATNGIGHEYEEGMLILEQGQLSVVSSPVGERFGDPQKVPLWSKVAGGSEAAKVAFTCWGIGVREGTGFRNLWEWQKLAKATVMFSDS